MNIFFTTLMDANASPSVGAYGWTSLIWMVVLILAFYFILIRPQRKKEKKDAEMRKAIQIGDEVVTVGGITGIVCKLEENTLVIETGGDRSKLRIMRWAVSQNLDADKEAKSASSAKKEKKKSDADEIEKD